ncbi:hypothetical protein FACS1894155_07600 [Bacteroidia bacterium]|nr:hypothetical protein FACS1894155_07600 [Bacteroidia bacterium]
MKRFILTALIALCGSFPIIQGQSNNQNYILKKTMRNSSGAASSEVIQYYDGLGKPEETVLKKASPQEKDIISRMEYDTFGREWKSWLPIRVNKSDGSYNGPYGASDFYVSEQGYFDSPAYSETIYESSPLNRVKESYGPGGEWRENSRSVKPEYLSNVSSGTIELICGKYQVSGTGLVKIGNYGSNQLYVTKTTDENNHVSYEFRDKLDRVVLQRQINGTGSDRCHDTYFVYDDFGNLAFVLPPLASDANGTAVALDKYGYIYRYDNRNRCVEKKLPGIDWQYFVYDRSDRLIWSQDGVQRVNNKWKYYKYDKLGRLIMTGIKPLNTPRPQLENQYKNLLIVEQYGNTGVYNYTNNSGLSMQYEELQQVNIYDTYDWMYNSNLVYQPTSGYDTSFGSAKGLLTVSLSKMADSPYNEVVTTFYYDHKGNVVQKRTRNHLDGTDCEFYSFNFNSQPLKRQVTHNHPNQSPLTEVYTYTYDHEGRSLQTTHQINGGTTKTIAAIGYDELGRMTSKNTGQIENVTFEYNIRGWLRKIEGNKFSENIRYTTHPHYGAVSNFNGNISAISWIDPLQTGTKGFTYHYDDLNRLLNASYGEGSGLTDMGNFYGEHFGYDKHGNLTYINRPGKLISGSYGSLDQVQFQSYDGNKVTSIHDFNSDQPGYDIMEFKNGYVGGTEYVYDSNGNLTQNLDKNISLIQYNCLNLPKQIDFQSGDWIQYLYDASGVKLRTTHYTASSGLTTHRDYINNKIYEDDILKTILTEEGYVEKNGSSFDYFYYLKDHLGNTRVVLNQSGTAVQVNNYYPFGLSMWETSSNQNNQPYKYNGKELDKMHGLNLYDYGARMYDPAIGRFTTMDPLAEKYYSVSPYTYCANNPINAYDLHGDSIWYTKDDNVITMHVTGKVINQSSDNINVNRAASDIASGISNAYSGEFTIGNQTYTMQTDVQLESVSSMDDVAGSDHLFVLADADGESARGATSMDGGKVMTIAASDYANDNWLSNTFSSNNTRTAVHEFGHAAGLKHESASGWRNLMTQGGGGTNVTPQQRAIMMRRQNTINRGTNSYYGQPYPYVHYYEKGQWRAIPASRLLNMGRR